MATQTLEGAVQRYGGYTSAGNITGYHARVATDADGKLLGVIAEGAPAGAPAVGDVIRLKLLPAGMVLMDSLVVVSKSVAGLAGSLGFAYEDGADDADVPQDDAHFGAGLNLSAAARLRCTTTKPMLRLPKEAWLTLTLTGAPTGEGVVDIAVFGERLGE